MDNKEELDYNEIGNITSDFIKVSDQLKNTCEKIIEKGFSKYPVIIPVSYTHLTLPTKRIV